MSWDFFISFSTKDKERVQQIVSLMEQQGATCWFQLRDSKQDFSEAIAQAIENSNALIVFLSHNSAKSKFVKNEINCASEQNLKICPVIIDGDIKDKEYNPIKVLIGTYNMLNITDEDCNTDEKLVAKIFNQLTFVPSVINIEEVSSDKPNISSIFPTAKILQTKHPDYIEEKEFIENLDLVDVIIPQGIKSIGAYAFAGCTNLKSIIIPDSVTEIGKVAFFWCHNLKCITIPESVTEINNTAFVCCWHLSHITVDEKNNKYHSANNCLIESASKTLIVGCNDSVIPTDGSVTRIAKFAFAGKGLKSITIPNNVIDIEEQAFIACKNIVQINIENGVQNIGYQTFAYCTALISISIPDSVTTIDSMFLLGCKELIQIKIGDGVSELKSSIFDGCNKLTSITIGKNVTKISYYIFKDCPELSSITINPDNSKYCSINNCIIDKKNKALVLGCKTSVIPADGSVTHIDSYAFSRCIGLTNINIPDRISGISESAFSLCTELTSITIPQNIISIGRCAFEGCSKLTHITYQGTKAQWKEKVRTQLKLFGRNWNHNDYLGNFIIRCTNGDIDKNRK